MCLLCVFIPPPCGARDHQRGWLMLTKEPFASARAVWWAGFIWLAAAAVFFRNFLLTGFDKIIGDAGDARLDIFLRENFLQFLRGQAEFLSPPMFFPIKGTLGYSDAYLLDALIYVPLRVGGIDPFLAFELLCVGISLVGFVSTNILLTHFGGVRQPLAALAATIFVFSNALYISMGHPQLYEVNFAALVAVLFLEAARSKTSHPIRSTTAGFLGGLVLALLFSTGYYVAWYFTFLSGIVLVSAAIVRFGLRPLGILRTRIYFALVRRNLSVGVAGAVGFAIGAIPFWKIYAPVVAQFSGRGYTEYEGPFLVDLLNVSGNNIVWGGLIERLQIVPKDLLYNGEHVIAVTPVLMLTFFLCAWAVWRNRLLSDPEDRVLRSVVLGCFLAAALMTVIMVKVGEFSLFWVVWHAVPGANALRSGTRAQIITNGFVVVVVAIVLARLLQRTTSRRVAVAVWALVLLCVAEQANVVSNHNLSRRQEVAALGIVATPPISCKSFYVAPHSLERGPAIQQINAMLIAQVAKVPTLNGYSGLYPPSWNLWETGSPSYHNHTWRWAASHGITDGLCRYDVAQRQWLQMYEDEALKMVGGVVEPGTSIDFRLGGDGGAYRTVGWSNSEGPGTWTEGPQASLAAWIAQWPAGDMILQVTARPFLVRDRHPTLQVDVVVNGSVVDRWSYRYDRDNDFEMRSARVPAKLLAGAPLLKVEFRIDRPASPKFLGIHPSDDRGLGLFFSRTSFLLAPPESGPAREPSDKETK
jgi:hypothetical protein